MSMLRCCRVVPLGARALATLVVLVMLSALLSHPARADVAGGRIERAVLWLGGAEVDAVWYLPAGDPTALVIVQHGFMRRCEHLRATTRQFMERGLAALCLNAEMAGGNRALAEALAAALQGGLIAPGGAAVPKTVIVGGHSAGALFASHLGAALAKSAPGRLAGAILFDPVAGAGFAANLQAISADGLRPVLAASANASGCNAQNNADPALRQLRSAAIAGGRDGFVGLRLRDRSTHVDAEGDDTTALAVRACGHGWPRRSNATVLRTLATQWAVDMARGARDAVVYPGGVFVEQLLREGAAQLIE